jgi:hypothetical protein
MPRLPPVIKARLPARLKDGIVSARIGLIVGGSA